MSYILDALKKAERERRLGTVPGLENAPGLQSRGHRRNRWTYLIAGALVTNAVLLGSLYLYWRYQDPRPLSAHTTKPTTAPAPTATNTAAAGQPESVGAGDKEPATVATVAAETGTENKLVASDEALPAIPSQPALASPVIAEVAEPASPAPIAEPDPVIDIKPPATATQPFSLPEPTTIAPLLADLPASFRQSLRPVTLTVHVYSKTPAGRFVFINDRRYEEGQRLVEGPLLESIQPRGVVLSYQGRRFMLTGEW
jgi:general secretion pathway protein B